MDLLSWICLLVIAAHVVATETARAGSSVGDVQGVER